MFRSAKMTGTIVGVGLVLLGCIVRPVEGDETTIGVANSATSEVATSGLPTTSGSGEPTTNEDADTSTGLATDPGTTGDDGEDPTGLNGCNMFAQDCPAGQKCTGYAEGGAAVWNATKCVPLMGDGQVGEPCKIQESGASGLDDCGKGLMCWAVDATPEGLCTAHCTGTEAAPLCQSDDFYCFFGVELALVLCLPNCDLLLQDCPGDDLCLATSTYGICYFDGSGEEGQVFDPCAVANGCDKGLLCVPPSAAAECDVKVDGCCLPVCDLDMPDSMCPGTGQSCVPLFTEPVSPKYAHVGLCMIPG